MTAKHKHKWSKEEMREDHIPGILWSISVTCECGATKTTAALADEEVVEPKEGTSATSPSE